MFSMKFEKVHRQLIIPLYTDYLNNQIEKLHKISRFQMICGVIHRALRKNARIKSYITMAVAVLLYGCGSWVPTNKIKKQIQTSGMNFLRSTNGCTRQDCFHNVDIREELQVK